jgi:hypothetical protein
MFVFATEHPVLAALAVLVAGWFVRFLQKGYIVRKTFHGQVCLIPSMTCLPSTNSNTARPTALMALGSSTGDGRNDDRRCANNGASSRYANKHQTIPHQATRKPRSKLTPSKSSPHASATSTT